MHLGSAVRRLVAPLARLVPTTPGRTGRAIFVAVLITGIVPVAAQEPTTTTTTNTTASTTSTTTTSTSTTTVPATTTTVGSASTTTTSSTVPPPTSTTPDGSSPSTTTSVPSQGPDLVPTVDPSLGEAALDEEELAALAALQGEYDELVAYEAGLLAEYEVRLGRVEELDRDLAVVDRDIADTVTQIAAARREVDRISAEQRVNEARHRETSADLDEAIHRLQQQAVSAYVYGSTGADQALEHVVDTGDPQLADIAMAYANVVVDNQRITVEHVNALEILLAELGEEIEASRAEAEDARLKLEELEQQLEDQRAGLQGDRDRADAERVEMERLLAGIRAQKAEYDQRLFAMDAESSNISGVLAAAQRDQVPAGTIPLLRAPLDGPVNASSGFGNRIHPIFGTMRRHNGLDLGGDLGDPIRAVEAGVVVIAEMRTGYGNTIVIDHGDRIASLYAHQSRFEVQVGDEVARGQLIGRIGSTGWSTGPHLHIEIRVGGVPADPILYLVDTEPIACEVLIGSPHAIDQEILARREDCQ